MSKGLDDALNAIKEGKAVNWPKVRHQLLRKGVTVGEIERTLTAQRYTDTVYEVTILDDTGFNQLLEFCFPLDASNRKVASRSGNTHKANVAGALLVALTFDRPESYNYILRNNLPIPSPTKSHALIIENLECFLEFEETYQFLKTHCNIGIPINEIEFLYAAGNSISNRLIQPFLQCYRGNVLCLLDVDLGGLTIFHNLIKGGLDRSRARFVVPVDLKKRLEDSRRIADTDLLESLSRVYGVTKETDLIISAIRHYKRTLEQESYRNDT